MYRAPLPAGGLMAWVWLGLTLYVELLALLAVALLKNYSTKLGGEQGRATEVSAATGGAVGFSRVCRLPTRYPHPSMRVNGYLRLDRSPPVVGGTSSG